ncbi:MAG: DDE-type integrase/transposase/recombinase [Candidatus Schekmanbacteria bacterium]|nr:DDE-type integrase/transposase/recombinase [Candidatus Schekmanbacteria bacterium]
MDEEHREKVALIRVSVLGPLISARLEHGDRARWFQQAAEKTYEGPDGRPLRVSPRTIEDWYGAWRRGGLQALKPKKRADAGNSRVIAPEIGELILQMKRERPRRSIRRIIRMLERADKVAAGRLKKSSVHRFLQSRGQSARPRRGDDERRAYRHPFAGDLWFGDVMHGPVVISPAGTRRKSYLHLFIDSATRFVVGCAFRLGETATDLEAVLREAIAKHGLPRSLYQDRGAAQQADSLRVICAELSIHFLHCRARDPAAKGGVERIFRTIDDEVINELPAEPLPLAELNGLLWSWLSVEYHRRVHSGTGQMPLEHWLGQTAQLRPAPRGERLDEVFLHRERRHVRKDSTIHFQGSVLEVRPELCGQTVDLRFDPHHPERLPRVFVEGRFYCDTIPLDVVRNASRPQRRIEIAVDDDHERMPTGIDPLRQIQAEHDRRTRSPQPQRPIAEEE